MLVATVQDSSVLFQYPHTYTDRIINHRHDQRNSGLPPGFQIIRLPIRNGDGIAKRFKALLFLNVKQVFNDFFLICTSFITLNFIICKAF